MLDLGLCNAVLVGDLFNKTTTSSSEAETEIATREFFSMGQSEAFNQYKKFLQKKSSESLGITARFIVKGFPVGADADGRGQREMTEEEFKSEFEKWKSVVREEIKDTRDYKLQNYYSSYVRDPQSIEAWRQCVDGQMADGGLATYGTRDGSNQPVLRILWKSPFLLATERNVLSIEPPNGVRVTTPRLSTQDDIRVLVVTSKRTGFSLPINVQVIDRDSGELRRTFSDEAQFPPTLLPAQNLGKSWDVKEGLGPTPWTGKWSRVGNTNQFNAQWSHPVNPPVTAKLTINRLGNSIFIDRVQSSDSNDCVYAGSVQGARITGSYKCTRGGGEWEATINQE